MTEAKNKGEELIIQQKVYDMILYAYPAIEQFPKSQKFSLAQDMKKCLDSIMRLVIATNKKYTKKTTLQELDIENEALKVYVRIAFELGYLPPKKYEILSRFAVDTGRMIGGWIKSTKDTQDGTEEKDACEKCGTQISKAVKEYSNKHFKQNLCRGCQK